MSSIAGPPAAKPRKPPVAPPLKLGAPLLTLVVGPAPPTVTWIEVPAVTAIVAVA